MPSQAPMSETTHARPVRQTSLDATPHTLLAVPPTNMPVANSTNQTSSPTRHSNTTATTSPNVVDPANSGSHTLPTPAVVNTTKSLAGRSCLPSTAPFTGLSASFGTHAKERKPWRRWCLFALILAVLIGIPLGWALRLRGFEAEDNNTVTVLALKANLLGLDDSLQSFTIDWEVVYQCDSDNNATCAYIDIYFDQNTLRSVDGPFPADNNVPKTPIFSLNGTVSLSGDLYGNLLLFRTSIAMSSEPGNNARTLQNYPFDRYTSVIFIFAKNAQTDEYINVSMDQTSGVAVGFNAGLTPVSSLNDTAILLYFEFTRGPAVRTYAIIIVISTWLVTLTLLSATVSSVMIGRAIAREVLLVPITTLFAFTQLRGTLPGAPPGFGALIDFVGVLPCLAILTMCSVFMLALFLFRDPEVDRTKECHMKTV